MARDARRRICKSQLRGENEKNHLCFRGDRSPGPVFGRHCLLCLAAEPQGHHFGKWPAINAVIHDESQKNLNLDDKDFLIEVWFKPLAKLKYKGNGPSSLDLQERLRRFVRLRS